MKRLALLALLPGAALASDHNNIDPGRPLRFEDASFIAYGERVLEFGFAAERSRSQGILEFKYGFALNQELAVGLAQGFGSNEGSRLGHVELSYLNAFQREIGGSPALAIRLGIGATRDERAAANLRFIATRALGQYDRIHLNLDMEASDNHPSFGAILGWSMPLGYPRRFDQTLVSELSYRREQGEWEGAFGLGLRQQLDPESTLDFGLEAGFNGETTFRIGFARSF